MTVPGGRTGTASGAPACRDQVNFGDEEESCAQSPTAGARVSGRVISATCCAIGSTDSGWTWAE